MTEHPITPSQELVDQWADDVTLADPSMNAMGWELRFATKAAQWGADKELDACCKWLPKLSPWSGDDLRRHRRPKPLSLKEQALALIDLIQESKKMWQLNDLDVVRKALELIDDNSN